MKSITKKGLFLLVAVAFAVSNHLTNFTPIESIAFHNSKRAARGLASKSLDKKQQTLSEKGLKILALFSKDSIRSFKKLSKQIAKLKNLEKLNILYQKAYKTVSSKIDLHKSHIKALRLIHKKITELEGLSDKEENNGSERKESIICLKKQLSKQKENLEEKISGPRKVLNALKEKLEIAADILGIKSEDKKEDLKVDILSKIFDSMISGRGFMHNPYSYYSDNFMRSMQHNSHPNNYYGRFFASSSPFMYDRLLSPSPRRPYTYDRMLYSDGGYYKRRPFRISELSDTLSLYDNFESNTKREFFEEDRYSLTRKPGNKFSISPRIKSHKRPNTGGAVFFNLEQKNKNRLL